MADTLSNIHPGEVLLEDFIQPLGLSQGQLAQRLGIPPRHLSEIVRSQRAITPDTALRLSRYFGTSSRFWLGLQLDYDLEETERSVGEAIRQEVKPRSLKPLPPKPPPNLQNRGGRQPPKPPTRGGQRPSK